MGPEPGRRRPPVLQLQFGPAPHRPPPGRGLCPQSAPPRRPRHQQQGDQGTVGLPFPSDPGRKPRLRYQDAPRRWHPRERHLHLRRVDLPRRRLPRGIPRQRLHPGAFFKSGEARDHHRKRWPAHRHQRLRRKRIPDLDRRTLPPRHDRHRTGWRPLRRRSLPWNAATPGLPHTLPDRQHQGAQAGDPDQPRPHLAHCPRRPGCAQDDENSCRRRGPSEAPHPPQRLGARFGPAPVGRVGRRRCRCPAPHAARRRPSPRHRPPASALVPRRSCRRPR